MRPRILIALFVCALALAQGLSRENAYQRAEALKSLGRKLFFDSALSSSGKTSCATCHDPRFAYGPAEATPIPPGVRAVPSLRYLQAIPPFSEHYVDADTSGDDSVDNGPTGGLTWDGRVDRGRDQARLPLLSPNEMANLNPASVVKRVLERPYADELRQLAGSNDVFEMILEALEVWQQDYPEFYPYSSKFDSWLAGKSELTPTERRGYELFIDSKKGDCSRCHIAERGTKGTPPQFTDYGLIAIGVARNSEIAANADPNWFDLGLCGPFRTDLMFNPDYCGRFRTPTLRNVALRKSFFHNGVAHSLKEAVSFYAHRDEKVSDLPLRYQVNLEPLSVKLTDDEIADIVTFLETLTDVSH